MDGSAASLRHARRTATGRFCRGHLQRLSGFASDSFDAAFALGSMQLLASEAEVCEATRELGRLIRPGARALIATLPESPVQCETGLRLPESVWSRCLQSDGAYRVEFIPASKLLPEAEGQVDGEGGSACSAQRAVLVHKKLPAAIFVHPQPKPKLAMLTVASAPTSSEYGREKVRPPQQVLATLPVLPNSQPLTASTPPPFLTSAPASFENGREKMRRPQQVLAALSPTKSLLNKSSRPFPCRPQASEFATPDHASSLPNLTSARSSQHALSSARRATPPPAPSQVHYLAELSIENKRRYCAAHGFEFVIAQNLRHGRTARWDKVMLLMQLLSRYEWLHWVDLDTLLMNMKRKPFDFLDPAFDLHIAKDANGLNTGSFYMRSSQWSKAFLT